MQLRRGNHQGWNSASFTNYLCSNSSIMSVLCGTVGLLGVQELDWSCSTLAAKVVRPENPQCPPCQGVIAPCTSHSFPWAHSTGQACSYTNRVWRAMSFHTEVSFQGHSTFWDMQYCFTSCPPVRMFLKPLVDVLPGKGPLGAPSPFLAHFSGFVFRPTA